MSERQLIAEDMIFDIDVIPYCKKIVHSDAALYYYRYNPASLTTTYKPDRFKKNVELYREMCIRLNRIYNVDEYFNSVSRYLIKVARIAVIQEEQFLKRNGIVEACKNVRRISSNKELQEILKKYKWKKLPIKYRIICYLQKHKISILQLFLCMMSKGK